MHRYSGLQFLLIAGALSILPLPGFAGVAVAPISNVPQLVKPCIVSGAGQTASTATITGTSNESSSSAGMALTSGGSAAGGASAASTDGGSASGDAGAVQPANSNSSAAATAKKVKIKGHVEVPANPYRGVNNSLTPFAPEGSVRRALPAPLDPVFPSTEYVGIASQIQIGVPDQDQVYPLEKAIYKACPILAKNRIKIYGWVNPGVDYSTSHKSNIPLSYAVIPRHVELDQAILRLERVPDTVQNEHLDWGFRATLLYGIDYRWTTSEGWYPASSELLKHNSVYGMDPVELYGMLYVPKVAKGMVIKYGRYISPPDIEAQLAPDNYLWTHSLMFTVDCYTQTGVLASIKLNDSWMVQAGISAGADMAPWSKPAVPTGTLLARWQSRNNKDMIYGGCNSINNGTFRNSGQHDNLQQFNLTWFHRFNRRFHIATEAYYLYELNALVGGTVNNGAPRPVDLLTGPGALIPGYSHAAGFVSYWNTKITDRDYITVRPVDYLVDPNGWRTGVPGTYASWTVGWCHHFSDLLLIRPEIRYERALTNSEVFDNATRKYQFTVGFDVIQRF